MGWDRVFIYLFIYLFYSTAKPGFCPAVDIHHVGICKSECSSDRDCQGDKKCCSNGCGRICSAPVQQGKLVLLYKDSEEYIWRQIFTNIAMTFQVNNVKTYPIFCLINVKNNRHQKKVL